MQAFIYRCNLKPDMYIYLAEEDVFDKVPKEIYNTLGIIEFVMELEITPETKLARENTKTVINNLKEHSFHIQLPANETVEAIMARLAQKESEEKNQQL